MTETRKYITQIDENRRIRLPKEITKNIHSGLTPFSCLFPKHEKPEKRLNLAEFRVFRVSEFTIMQIIGRSIY